MEDSKTFSVSMSAEHYSVLESLAERKQRTLNEVLQESLLQCNEQWKPKNYAEAVRWLQQDARAKGMDQMTMEEIDAEIAACRFEQREKEATRKSA